MITIERLHELGSVEGNLGHNEISQALHNAGEVIEDHQARIRELEEDLKAAEKQGDSAYAACVEYDARVREFEAALAEGRELVSLLGLELVHQKFDILADYDSLIKALETNPLLRADEWEIETTKQAGVDVYKRIRAFLASTAETKANEVCPTCGRVGQWTSCSNIWHVKDSAMNREAK